MDPAPDNDFSKVIEIAFDMKEILESLHLKPYVMTTGSKGIHVSVPLDMTNDYETVQTFAAGCAVLLINKKPDDVTNKLRKDKRENKLFIDVLRNGYGSLAIAPYSVRPKPGAPVATPIAWEDLNYTVTKSQQYNINNIFEILDNRKGPWKDFLKKPQSIEKAKKTLIEMLSQK